MNGVLFLQSEVKDPYAIYAKMLAESPLYYDSVNKIWAVYSYSLCKAVLEDSLAWIPEGNAISEGLSDDVKSVIQHLVRISNPPNHNASREAAVALLSQWKEVETSRLIQLLVGEPRTPAQIDWVNDVGKRLPAFALLKGFGFSAADIDQILPQVEGLTTLMLPNKTREHCAISNNAVGAVMPLFNSYILSKLGIEDEGRRLLYTSNFIGLLIQGFDAGRGLLCNAMLQLISGKYTSGNGVDFYQNIVRETLRFDPPVHNTRRVITEAIKLQGRTLQQGDQVLVVVAAANRDRIQFKQPQYFDITRRDNPPYLTFGSGPHQCIAEHYISQLVASTLYYVHSKYEKISLRSDQIAYEPRVNIRMPMEMCLTVS